MQFPKPPKMAKSTRSSKKGFKEIIYLLFNLKFYFLVLLIPFQVAGQDSLDSLKLAFEQEENDTLKILTELRLSREIHRKNHDADLEISYAQDAIDRALNLNDTLLYARALDNMGLLYRYHQNYDQAMPLHIKAFDLIKDVDVDPVYKMIFANNAGVAGRYDQKYDTAISYYMEALRIAERENDLKNLAISSNGIGIALSSIPERQGDALMYFEKSLEAEIQQENSLGIAMNYLSISDYYIGQREFKKARSHLQKLLEINKQRNDRFGLAITNEYFGISYLEEGVDLQKATAYFNAALESFQSLDNGHKQAEILALLGDVHSKRGQAGAALTYFKNSLDLAKKLNHQGIITANSLRLAELLERKGNYEEALQMFRQGKAYEDSIKLSEQEVEIAALIKQYDLEKKEGQIQLLEKDKALQQTLLANQDQQLERRRMWMLILGGGLLSILAIVLLQYRNYRTKQEINTRLVAEEKEKMKAVYERNLARAEILVTRLRINPHFLFNSLNAITYLIQTNQNSKAIKYLVVFSRYTRMVLETSQQHVVPLTEELKLTRYYLTLEENRFEKDFIYRIEGEESREIGKELIPPLLLQPFIENAIWHGLLPSKKEEKVLSLEVRQVKNGVEIIIDDNGVGRKVLTDRTKASLHKSMGMKITEERIELYNKSYPGKIHYKIIDKRDEQNCPEGTQVIITLKSEAE